MRILKSTTVLQIISYMAMLVKSLTKMWNSIIKKKTVFEAAQGDRKSHLKYPNLIT